MEDLSSSASGALRGALLLRRRCVCFAGELIDLGSTFLADELAWGTLSDG
jgi:hypothetical protein